MQVNDGLPTSGTQDVTFTITGTNDAPVLSDTTNPAAVLELHDASAQNLAPITGSFAVTDLDMGDTLTPSVGGPTVLLNGSPFVLPAGAAALTAAGAFTSPARLPTAALAPSATPTIPAAANLDFLRNGQSLTITYAVKVNDGTADSDHPGRHLHHHRHQRRAGAQRHDRSTGGARAGGCLGAESRPTSAPSRSAIRRWRHADPSVVGSPTVLLMAPSCCRPARGTTRPALHPDR